MGNFLLLFANEQKLQFLYELLRIKICIAIAMCTWINKYKNKTLGINKNPIKCNKSITIGYSVISEDKISHRNNFLLSLSVTYQVMNLTYLQMLFFTEILI